MTAATLFRAEALAHHRGGDQAGVPLPAAPPPAVLAWALLGCVLLGGVVAACGSYARTQRVVGYLAPPSGVVRIAAPGGGVIVAVAVQDGDAVAAGAPLLTVQRGGADAAGADVDGAVLAALDRQRARLAEQVGIEQAGLARERARLADHLATLADEQAALQAQLRLQSQRTGLSQLQAQAAQSLLASGNISRIELQRRQDAVLAQLQAAAGLARDLAAKRAQIDQDSHALLALPDATAARIAALRAQIADIETRSAETSGRRATLLRAPIAGRVTALQAAVGQAARPDIPLLAIVPSGEALRAELLVPARAIGEVRPGQTVRIGIDAFPVARFGLARGRVLAVSRSLLRPAELAGPLVAAEPCYRVSAALDAQEIGAGAAALPLLPDLTISAAIVIDRHTLFGWLLAPLRDRIQPRV